MEDYEIIQNIRSGSHEKPIRHLYKELPKIKSNILSSGGNKEIAEEIFNDALVLLIEKVSDPNFELTSRVSTYLYGIARFLWKNELRKQNKNIELEWSDTLILSAKDLDYEDNKEEYFVALEKVIGSLSEKCQVIFNMFYFKNQNMQTIAWELGFSSVNSAKTQKYKCMEQAIKIASSVQSKM